MLFVWLVILPLLAACLGTIIGEYLYNRYFAKSKKISNITVNVSADVTEVTEVIQEAMRAINAQGGC